MSVRQIRLDVLRYNPETESAPHVRSYEVP